MNERESKGMREVVRASGQGGNDGVKESVWVKGTVCWNEEACRGVRKVVMASGWE